MRGWDCVLVQRFHVLSGYKAAVNISRFMTILLEYSKVVRRRMNAI